MTPDPLDRVRSIRDIPALIAYLRDELDWPIGAEAFDELTFEYEPEELGIDARTAARIEEIKQLRPLAAGQPWGVFFIGRPQTGQLGGVMARDELPDADRPLLSEQGAELVGLAA